MTIDFIEEPKTGWLPSPNYPECQEYVDSRGQHIARIEDFGYAAYPSAHNPVTGNWERHGPTQDRIAGMLWAERVAGVHPVKSEDERQAFYYEPKKK